MSCGGESLALPWLSIRCFGWAALREEPIEPRLPELDAAGDSGLVGDDGDIRRQFEVDSSGVSSADVQPVVIQQRSHNAEHPLDPAVPFVRAFGCERGRAEIFVISLSLPDRMLAELEMGHELAVAIDRAANASAQRQNTFETLALDHTQALHLGIVQHA